MPHEFGITDCATFLRQDHPSLTPKPEGVRITSFAKIVTSLYYGATRFMVACDIDDPELCVIGTAGIGGRHHRPWELTWNRPVPWPIEHIKECRDTHRKKIAKGIVPLQTLSSDDYPALFAHYPPLSAHERMLVQSWVQDCRNKAAAWTLSPQ